MDTNGERLRPASKLLANESAHIEAEAGEHADLPPPFQGQPGPFSLGTPGVIEDLCTRAGLRKIETVKIDAPVILDSAKDCLRFEKESFGALHQMLGKLNVDAKQRAWDDVEKVLEGYESKDGFRGPCTMIAASGIKATNI